jgi:hypothetical protein
MNYKLFYGDSLQFNECGGAGIRTPGTLSGTAVFKTAVINRSTTPPYFNLNSHSFLNAGAKIYYFFKKGNSFYFFFEKYIDKKIAIGLEDIPLSTLFKEIIEIIPKKPVRADTVYRIWMAL